MDSAWAVEHAFKFYLRYKTNPIPPHVIPTTNKQAEATIVLTLSNTIPKRKNIKHQTCI